MPTYREKVKQLQKDMETLNESKRKEKAKEFVQGLIDKAILTSTIHAISELEARFGELWNISEEDESVLTPEQARWDELFEEWRKSVLDKANFHKRRLLNDLDGFDMEFKKVNFKVGE